MSEVDINRAVKMYLSAKEKGTPQEIENAKYKLLWEASNLLEIIANYIALEKSANSGLLRPVLRSKTAAMRS